VGAGIGSESEGSGRIPAVILDPRFFGLNDLLRRPFTQESWGTEALTLTIQADYEPVLPADGHWRPSHTSLYGRAELSGLQLAQNHFVARDGTHVVSLLIRNPSSDTVFVELAPRWETKIGASASGWVHRCTPPLDDLLVHLPADALVTRTFTLASAATEEGAVQQATRWFFEPSPEAVQRADLERWCAENACLFDASDPWLTRLVAHCQALRWLGSTPRPLQGESVAECFVAGDFDAPRADCPAWDTAVQERLVGARCAGGKLQLTPDNFLGLSSFCLQGFHNTTIVWDDPAHPADAYNDGDKGLTVYVGRVRAYNQPTLAPCEVPLTR
jgi:hypothetical protein